MNFFKRATTSIIRRPGKTIILLLLVFILGSVIAGAISVEGAISNTDANLRRNMQPIVSIEFDWMDWESSIDWEAVGPNEDPWMNQPRLTPTDVRAIGALPYVDFYDYLIRGWLQSFELEGYWGENTFVSGMDGMPNHIEVQGTSRTSMVQIEQDIIQLIQGNQFSEGDLQPGADIAKAIISEGFARQNDLSLGSTFELSEFVFNATEGGMMWSPDMFNDENVFEIISQEFEVIGIFDIEEAPDSAPHGQEWNDRMNALNTIYVPNWAIEDIQRRFAAATALAWEESGLDIPAWAAGNDEERESSVTPLFILEDPSYIDDFRSAGEELLPESHFFQDMSNAFNGIASSMATMQNIANWILYVSIGATLLILSLLITLFLRDRRYEMGVYLALGEKKGKVISQILLEVLVTSFVAITLSVFVGNLISSQVSRNMLMNELTAEAQDDHGWRNEWTIFDQIGIPTNNMTVDEMLEAYDVSLTPGIIGLFYAIGLGAVIVSSLIPVMYVVTLNPKKVLM